MQEYELIVIGGGPAGLAAAYRAHQQGVRSILVMERDEGTGGILNQCIHNGFGLHYFKEELTGPEYAQRFEDLLQDTSVEILTGTMVLEVTKDRQVYALSRTEGAIVLQAKAIVLAMGCRERTRGAIQIPGERPSGVLTAGTAQRYLNMEGYMVGKRVVILGSGDIGLIMARRMTLEGAEVLAVIEIMPYSNGLNRNLVQCLQDYDIPLYLSHTITDIRGHGRLRGITMSEVDTNRQPIAGTEQEFECDTLLLSVGLIPENEVSKQMGVSLDPRSGGAVVFDDMQTTVEGVFACGNVLHVHDLVDFVTEESLRAGESAASYIQHHYHHATDAILTQNGAGVSYVVPQNIDVTQGESQVELFFRVNQVFQGATVVVRDETGNVILQKKRPHLLPAEMERLQISKQQLQHCKELVIAVEGGNSNAS